MGKGYLIDTNAVIDYLDDKLPAKTNAFIDGIYPNISVITRIELLAWPGASEPQTQVLQNFVDISGVFNLNEEIVIKTISIRKSHKTKLPDAIIAATAWVNEFTIITRNTVDFKNIERLDVLNPYDI